MTTAKEQFEASTREHRMTVLHDHAPAEPYRHLRFARPGTGIWRFDIVTWPGHLAVTGDIASVVFARLHDMLPFFHHDRINPGYWAEKVVAGVTRDDFDRATYEALVWEHVREVAEDLGPGEQDGTILQRAVEQDLLSDDIDSADLAYQALQDFQVFLPGLNQPVGLGVDTWEWDLSCFDHHFLLACHAARHAAYAYFANGGLVAASVAEVTH